MERSSRHSMGQLSWPSGMQEKTAGSMIPMEGIIAAFPHIVFSVYPVLPALPNALFYKLLDCPNKSNLELVQFQDSMETSWYT